MLYSYENLKVHCKLCLIERVEGRRTVRYAYLGTGNFNERTSRIYTDMALITARPAITREVAEVFAHLADRRHRPVLAQLLMAPLNLRGSLELLIDKEIENARTGRPSGILLKLNSLEDRTLIRKLYDASNAGVPVRLIIRGICCLVPGVEELSSRIEAISIVDRFLEHTRVFWWRNGGEDEVYLSSADWMPRNLNRRIEVAFPVLDPAIQKRIVEDIIPVEMADNTFAWDQGPDGQYSLRSPGEAAAVRAQATFVRLTRKRAHSVRKAVRPELSGKLERLSPALRAAAAQQRRQRQEG